MNRIKQLLTVAMFATTLSYSAAENTPQKPTLSRTLVGLSEKASDIDYCNLLNSFAGLLLLQDRLCYITKNTALWDEELFQLQNRKDCLTLNHLRKTAPMFTDLPTRQTIQAQIQKLESPRISIATPKQALCNTHLSIYPSTPKSWAAVLAHFDVIKEVLMQIKIIPECIKIAEQYAQDEDETVQYVGHLLKTAFALSDKQTQICHFDDSRTNLINIASSLCNRCNQQYINSHILYAQQVIKNRNELFDWINTQILLNKKKELEIPYDMERRYTEKSKTVAQEYALVRESCASLYKAITEEIDRCIGKSKGHYKLNLMKYRSFNDEKIPPTFDETSYPEYQWLKEHFPSLVPPAAIVTENNEKNPASKPTKKPKVKKSVQKAPAKKQSGKKTTITPETLRPTAEQKPKDNATENAVTTDFAAAPKIATEPVIQSQDITAELAPTPLKPDHESQPAAAPQHEHQKVKTTAIHKQNIKAICKEVCNCTTILDPLAWVDQFPYCPETTTINETPEMITIHDTSNQMILYLFAHKKINNLWNKQLKYYPHGDLLEWFTDTKQALIKKGFCSTGNHHSASRDETMETIQIHRFSRFVDRYVPTMSYCYQTKSHKNPDQIDICLAIPGQVQCLNDTDSKPRLCCFVYLIDSQTSFCYHRNITYCETEETLQKLFAGSFWAPHFPPAE